MDGPSECSVENACSWTSKGSRRMSFGLYRTTTAERRCDIGQLITFNMLPNEVLLKIFHFYVDIEKWITLVHVCRYWRNVVFQFPRHLNLRLYCTSKTPTRDTLDIWPPLPLVIHDCYRNSTSGVDDIITALEHHDRVSQIQLNRFSSSELGYVMNSVPMQKPFLELTDLVLGIVNDDSPILPNSFLGGTAPRLRSLWFCNVPSPGLPKLLLSATHLVDLKLQNIPPSGYIPPEAMFTSLSTLTSLKNLSLHFQFPLISDPEGPPPLTRSILPSLSKIRFQGAS